MRSSLKMMVCAVCLSGVVALGVGPALLPAAAPDEVSEAAVERARREVRMLDDLYKSAVVLITENYVNEESDLAAGSAAIALFDAMKKKGWHEVRLLDVTGEPIDEDNLAQDDFERTAIEKLKAGKPYYDRIEMRDGKPQLRAATPIPVVLKKCTMCHDHYNDAKPGEPIGALAYTLPIE